MLGGIQGLEDLDLEHTATGLALTDEAAIIPVLDENGDTQMIALDLKKDLAEHIDNIVNEGEKTIKDLPENEKAEFKEKTETLKSHLSDPQKVGGIKKEIGKVVDWLRKKNMNANIATHEVIDKTSDFSHKVANTSYNIVDHALKAVKKIVGVQDLAHMKSSGQLAEVHSEVKARADLTALGIKEYTDRGIHVAHDAAELGKEIAHDVVQSVKKNPKA